MTSKILIDEQLKEAVMVKKAMLVSCQDSILQAAELICRAFKKGNKLLICGNGGSAADAQHMAGELVNKFRFERPPLPAIALTTDTSVLSSIANDSSFSFVFSKQVEALGKKGDVLMVITTSDIDFGKNAHSSNLAMALKVARKKGLKTIGLVSQKSRKILKFLDVAIKIPSKDTPRIQEGHLLAEHIICDLIEQKLFKKRP